MVLHTLNVYSKRVDDFDVKSCTFLIVFILNNSIITEANEYIDLVLCRNTLDDEETGRRLFFKFP